jgi:hypothetical protein
MRAPAHAANLPQIADDVRLCGTDPFSFLPVNARVRRVEAREIPAGAWLPNQ